MRRVLLGLALMLGGALSAQAPDTIASKLPEKGDRIRASIREVRNDGTAHEHRVVGWFDSYSLDSLRFKTPGDGFQTVSANDLMEVRVARGVKYTNDRDVISSVLAGAAVGALCAAISGGLSTDCRAVYGTGTCSPHRDGSPVKTYVFGGAMVGLVVGASIAARGHTNWVLVPSIVLTGKP